MAPVQARRERRLAESKQHMLQREVRIANLDLWRAGPRASAEPLRVLIPVLGEIPDVAIPQNDGTLLALLNYLTESSPDRRVSNTHLHSPSIRDRGLSP